jgi:hypothetical protein
MGCGPVLDPEVMKDRTLIALIIITLVVSIVVALMCLGYV